MAGPLTQELPTCVPGIMRTLLKPDHLGQPFKNKIHRYPAKTASKPKESLSRKGFPAASLLGPVGSFLSPSLSFNTNKRGGRRRGRASPSTASELVRIGQTLWPRNFSAPRRALPGGKARGPLRSLCASLGTRSARGPVAWGAAHLIALTVILEAARAPAVTAFVVARLHIPQLAFPNLWLESFWVSIKTCLGQKTQNPIKMHLIM